MYQLWSISRVAVFHVLAVEVSTLKQYTITFTSFGGISRVVLFDVLAVGVSTLTRYTVTFTIFGGISRVVLFHVYLWRSPLSSDTL
jgi:hypothetical protein